MANFRYTSKPRGKQKPCPNHPQKLMDAKFSECYICYAKKNNLEIDNLRASVKGGDDK